MQRRVIIGILIIFLLIVLPLSMGKTFQSNPIQTWYVDMKNTDGPWTGSLLHPFSHIQTAINQANAGDIVTVLNGIYNETLIIDKAITLQNQLNHNPIIDGQYNHTIIQILHPEVTVKGFTIRNSSGSRKSCGIRCEATEITISQCQFYRTKSGILIEDEQNITVKNNFFHTNGEGIAIINSNYIVLQMNDFMHNALGINTDNSRDIFVENCYATVNGIGVFLNNSKYITIIKTACFNNNDNQGGVFLNNCENMNFENCRIEHNGFGIKPFDCKYIHIDQSTLQYNTHVGFYAKGTKNISINHSLFTNNFRYSINTDNSTISIHQSNIFSSLVGLYAEKSIINAINNYWGSPFGPVFFEHQKISRIRLKSSSINLWPVSSKVFNSGANWEIDYSRCKMPNDTWLHPIIKLNGTDSDHDGVLDSWEEQFGYDPFNWDDHQHLDPDNDGLSNIEECYTAEWGSNPFQKDIFLEMDWMASRTANPNQNRLTQEDIKKMEDAFAVNNINLHIDHGELGGGEKVSYQSNFSYADLRDIYWDYFLHEDLNNPRKGIFHYGIINDWGPGPGFAFIGWDSLDSFDISAQELIKNHQIIHPNILITGGSIHELGHTLGLTVDDHPGNDNQIATWLFSKQWWQYRQYKSCMNYWYTYKILGFSDGSHGPYDFNDWEHMDLAFFKNTHFNLPENIS